MKGVYANSGGNHRQNNSIWNSDHDLNELDTQKNAHGLCLKSLAPEYTVQSVCLLQFSSSVENLARKSLRRLVRESKQFQA